jgi:hypothetical protein
MLGAFTGCSSLVAFDVDRKNRDYASIDGVLYDKSVTELIQYPAGRPDASFVMPDTVTIIGPSAFQRAADLQSVTLSYVLTSIESRAFWGCSALTSIDIPSSVSHISYLAFSGCTSLTSINFLGTTPPVGDWYEPWNDYMMRLGVPAEALGHAYPGSDFPAPGSLLGMDLLMGDHLSAVDVTIDIKPGTGINVINPGDKGLTTVAVLGSSALDVRRIDTSSIVFGPTGTEAPAVKTSFKDVNGDGILDLVCQFTTMQLGFDGSDTQGVLNGKMLDGMMFTGTDDVRILAK